MGAKRWSVSLRQSEARMHREDKQFKSMWTVKKMMRTWKTLRRYLKSMSMRDCLDYLEFEVEARERIKTLRARILNGNYSPQPAIPFEQAKGRGAFRVLSILPPEDAIVFRILADEVYHRAQPHEYEGAYFGRNHRPPRPVGPKVDGPLDPDFYLLTFPVWIRYNQYRTNILLNPIRPILVVTDISNYFESIHHELLLEYIAPLGLPRTAIGLLSRILEAYKPSSGLSRTPSIGLPVDEYDCSRQLAHVFLFEHDYRMVKAVGHGYYVRWMDDQNIAATSLTDARRIVRELTKSLSQQRLTLNTAKTKFLGPSEVALYFHLDTNEQLNDLEYKISSGADPLPLQSDLELIFREALKNEGYGNWDKVLKRFYRLAGMLQWPGLKKRAYCDLVEYPVLARRIFEYFIALRDLSGLLSLFQQLVRNGESIYESVEVDFFESILLTNFHSPDTRLLRRFARDWAVGKIHGSGRTLSQGVAALVLFWLGDGRSITTIESILNNQGHVLPGSVVRALLASYVALDPHRLVNTAMRMAARIGGSEVTRLMGLIERLLVDRRLRIDVASDCSTEAFGVGDGDYRSTCVVKVGDTHVVMFPACR